MAYSIKNQHNNLLTLTIDSLILNAQPQTCLRNDLHYVERSIRQDSLM